LVLRFIVRSFGGPFDASRSWRDARTITPSRGGFRDCTRIDRWVSRFPEVRGDYR